MCTVHKINACQWRFRWPYIWRSTLKYFILKITRITSIKLRVYCTQSDVSNSMSSSSEGRLCLHNWLMTHSQTCNLELSCVSLDGVLTDRCDHKSLYTLIFYTPAEGSLILQYSMLERFTETHTWTWISPAVRLNASESELTFDPQLSGRIRNGVWLDPSIPVNQTPCLCPYVFCQTLKST